MDAMNYSGKPALLPNMARTRVISEAALWAGAPDQDEPYEVGVRRESASVEAMGLSAGYPIPFNIERWELNNRIDPPENVAASVAKLVEIFGWAAPYMPQIGFGIYAMVPLRDYWTPVTGDPVEIAKWHAANDAIQQLADTVEAVYPSLYTFYEDQEGWVTYARANISEAKRLAPGKPIYPFIWPQYHDSNEAIGGDFLPADYWAVQLETLRDEGCDGVVIWSPPSPAWDAEAPWWLATQAFVASLAS